MHKDPQAQATAVAERHHSLDLLRGLAAMGIAVYHFLAWEMGVVIESLGRFTVYFFFILSALTMMIVYAKKFADNITAEDAMRFYRNRIARLIPLLLAVAIFSLILDAVDGLEVKEVLMAFLTGTGLFGLQLPGYLSNTPNAWSLGIEGLFYIVFPVMALLANRANARQLVSATLFLVFGQQALLLLLGHTISDPDQLWDYYTTPLMFAPFFAIGFIIHYYGGEQRGINLLFALLFLAAMFTYSLAIPESLLKSPVSYLTLTLVTSAAVLFAYRSSLPVWLTGIASFLGNISYALYLTHWAVEPIVRRIARIAGLPLWAQFVVFIVAAVLVSAIVYRFFEKPARDFFRGDHGSSSKLGTLP